MMQSHFTALWFSLNVANVVTVSYDIDRRQITITDNLSKNWFIADTSSFAKYGGNVVKFNYFSPAFGLNTYTHSSTSLGMIYSRFVLLHSNRLTEDQRSYSMVSKQGPSNIVAVIDLASQYQTSQFVVSSAFPGTDVAVDCLKFSPRINVLNYTKAFKLIDLSFIDEYGFNLNDINTNTFPFDYPVVVWLMGYM
jgi:hypothetical protein